MMLLESVFLLFHCMMATFSKLVQVRNSLIAVVPLDHSSQTLFMVIYVLICFIAHSCSPISIGKYSIVLPAIKTCASLVLLAKVSPQPPFVEGDQISCSVS